MKCRAIACVVWIALACSAASAQTLYDVGRKAWVIMEAGAEYCPDIEATWTASASIKEASGYWPDDTAELSRIAVEKKKLFDSFRTVPRVLACEMLMQEYGPGGKVHLFQFR